MTSSNDVLTPNQLNTLARDLLESTFPMVWVEGELGGVSRPASGHLYFTLKDARAQVRAAMFKPKSQWLKFIPREGMRVLVRGRLTLYEARGDYQLILDHMEEAGEGALRRAYDELKARLEAEGLFDPARKRPLPAHVRRLAVITSPTGAVVIDPADGPIWIMPHDCQHMSLLEITHSVPPQEVDALLTRLRPNLEKILHLDRGTTLCRPLVCFDASGVALTFVPVDNEPYTYTHLRADIFDRVRQCVPIASRYQVPSAHIALVRFVEKITDDQVTLFLDTIDRINRELEHSTLKWTVGSENGLSCRCGRIWYGGGWTELVGNTID